MTPKARHFNKLGGIKKHIQYWKNLEKLIRKYNEAQRHNLLIETLRDM